MRYLRLSVCCARLLIVAALLLAGPARAQQPGLTSAGTINARIIHKSGISIVFNSNGSGVPLGGSGTDTVTLNYGTVSRYGALGAGVSRTSTANNFTVSTPFDVNVQQSGSGSASYNLTASLSVAPGVYTYTFDAAPALTNTTPVQVVTNDPNYGVNRTHTLYLTVPNTAPAGAVSNTVNVTAVAN